jgi:hypothetical protein
MAPDLYSTAIWHPICVLSKVAVRRSLSTLKKGGGNHMRHYREPDPAKQLLIFGGLIAVSLAALVIWAVV